MKTEDILALVVRALGLFLGLQALAFLPGLILAAVGAQAGESETQRLIMTSLLGMLMSLALAFLFLRRAHYFTRQLVKNDEPATESVDLAGLTPHHADTTPVFRLLLRVSGAVLVALALSELTGHVVLRGMMHPMGFPPLWIESFPGLAKLAFGVYFLKGAPHLVDFAYGEPTTPKKD